MRSRRSALAPALLFLAAMLTGGWFLQRGFDQEENVYFQARLFQEVVDHLAERYVDPVERNELYNAAVEGMIQNLGDPNTSLLNVSDYENFRIQTEGDYGGVGLEIVERDGWVTVVTPLPGTPGQRAGIRAGDQIAEIDGESAEGWTTNQAVEVLRGRPGSEAWVGIRRPGVDEIIPFTLTRAVIEIHSVPFAMMLDEKVGYVPLQVFRESATREVRAAIDSLVAEGMEGLVLDLRGNPGGLLDQGVALSNLFLESGRSVVETKGKSRDQNQTLTASRDEAFPDLSLVVLVDERSASASEIVAGALQDHDRALLIGATSFGKGSVQTLYRLSGGNVLKLTTARWYTPSGRSIEKPADDNRSLGRDGVLTIDAQMTLRPDTAGRDRYTSGRGRLLYGGGGITPDILLAPDTLSTGEQAAVQRVYREAGAFNAAIFSYAVQYLQANPGLDPGFDFSDAELDDFYRNLGDRGLRVERDTFAGAKRFVKLELEREIALQKWGTAEVFRRRLPLDAPIQEALRLLRTAASQDNLFRVAGGRFGETDAALSERAAVPFGDERRDDGGREGGLE
ncbi:MAG: S41 family peptidase [Gemmatimonadota bacterium]